MLKPRTVQRILAIEHFRLLADDKQTISESIVSPGKVTSGKKKTTSDVWTYFGHLLRVKCDTLSTFSDKADVPAELKWSDLILINDQSYYCTQYPQKVQSDTSSSVSDIKSYSLASLKESLQKRLLAVRSVSRSVSNILSRVCCALCGGKIVCE